MGTAAKGQQSPAGQRGQGRQAGTGAGRQAGRQAGRWRVGRAGQGRAARKGSRSHTGERTLRLLATRREAAKALVLALGTMSAPTPPPHPPHPPTCISRSSCTRRSPTMASLSASTTAAAASSEAPEASSLPQRAAAVSSEVPHQVQASLEAPQSQWLRPAAVRASRNLSLRETMRR